MLFRSDRKSTRLNSSHTLISYAVFCLKKKKKKRVSNRIRQRTCISHHSSISVSCDVVILSVVCPCLSICCQKSPPFFIFFFFLLIGGPPKFPLFPSPPFSR